MMRQLLVFLVVSLHCMVTTATDWPVFQQNSQRNAKTDESLNVSRLSLVWTRQFAGPPNPAWSGPAKWDAYAGIRGLKSMRNYDPAYHVVVAGDRLWFGSSVDDSVHCLDLGSGATHWEYCTDAPIRIAPSYVQGRLYFGSDDGHAYCVSADRGELLWRMAPRPTDRRIVNNGRLISKWPIRSGVLVDGETAYFGASLLPWEDSYLCAVDASTGEVSGPGRYLQTLEDATMEGPLSLLPGRYLVSPQGRVAPKLYAIEDGRELGALQGGGGSFVVLTKDSVFHGPGNKTGWLTASSVDSLETIASYKSGNAMVVAGDVSFILTDKSLSAANYVTREQIWRIDCDCPLSLILAGNTLFVGGQDRVRGFDAASGEQVWDQHVDGKAFALTVANGYLVVSTDTGKVYTFAEGAPHVAQLPSIYASQDDPAQPTATENLQAVQAERDPSMKDRWVFQSPHTDNNLARNLAGGPDLSADGRIRLTRVNDQQAVNLRQADTSLRVTDDLAAAELPVKELSAVAWVRIDEPTRWGGIVGAMQDNGDYERGWLLGYEVRRFRFALNSAEGDEAKLSSIEADHEFEPGSWHHVAGTYDGSTMRLYVDGREVGSTQAEKGPIDYPPSGAYVVGGYVDDDESNLLDGLIHEVRVYRRALTETEVREQFQGLSAAFPQPSPSAPVNDEFAQLAVGPILCFDSRGEALISYRTTEAVPTTVILYQQGAEVRRVETSHGVQHQVRIDGLQHNSLYTYEIEFSLRGKVVRSPEFECDTFFDFSVARSAVTAQDVPVDAEPTTAEADQLAVEIGRNAKGQRGICVCLGAHDGSAIRQVVDKGEWRVIVFDEDEQRVSELRSRLKSWGAYGTRVTVHHVDSLENLPVTSRIANVVFSESSLAGGSFPSRLAEVYRLLVPNGIAVFGGTAQAVASLPAEMLEAGRMDDQQECLVLHGLPIEGAGEWSHIYGSAANNHYGDESLSGAQQAEDFVVQWLGRPGARYQADRNGRKPPPLATSGRIFLQGLHRIIAIDQYNGTILWSLEIPVMDRYNMPRDCGNWCADAEFVYLAVQGQCWKLSTVDGSLAEVIELESDGTPDGRFDWGFVARDHDLLFGSSVRPGNVWTDFWGKQAWYDSDEGPVTDKVSSDVLFALEAPQSLVEPTGNWQFNGNPVPMSAHRRWQYTNGAIVNSTITVGEGTVFFVESRGEHLQGAGRRLGGEAFWQNQFLVALDAQTGKLCWQRELDTEDGTTAFYAAYGDGRLVLVASAKRKYHIYSIQAKSGRDLWNSEIPWGKGKADHGSHLSRPAIVGSQLFVRPGVFDLETGKKLPVEIPVGGCGTYACTDQAVFFRAGSGKNSAVWAIQDGQYTTWDRLRPDCWLSTIPAGGMLLSPEGGGGCSCGSWLETSIGFLPRQALGRKGIR